MKTNAIVRIILFSVAILVLTSILVGGIAFRLFSIDIDSGIIINSGTDLPVVTDGDVTTGAVDADQVNNIQVMWVFGSVQIRQEGNAPEIIITETALDDPNYRMVYRLSGDTLVIQYCKDSVSVSGIGDHTLYSKNLVIIVPEGWNCEELQFETAMAELDVINMTIDEVDFDGASGGCTFENCTVNSVEMDTASGDVRFTGTLNALDFDGASGDLTLALTNQPSEIDVDAVSGDLMLTLPESCGFTVSMDGLSSHFSTDFATTTVNGYHTYGDGSCRITVDAVSGDVTIRKAQ